ncbi:hypothetical protein [Streptacidiphilus sp. PAMC 29251]
MPSTIPSIDIPEPTGTAAGCCRNCGKWRASARIVREVHSDSGAGATIVQCCDRRRPKAERPRTYSL